MAKGIKGFIKGHRHNDETKRKIGLANSNRIYFLCDYCGVQSSDKPSHFKRKKRHFCSKNCYATYRKDVMPKYEQNRYGTGLPETERLERRKARCILNHHLRDKHISRPPCEICKNPKSEAHHDDYKQPLKVKWLCFKHHRLYHKYGSEIYQNPELLK